MNNKNKNLHNWHNLHNSYHNRFLWGGKESIENRFNMLNFTLPKSSINNIELLFESITNINILDNECLLLENKLNDIKNKLDEVYKFNENLLNSILLINYPMKNLRYKVAKIIDVDVEFLSNAWLKCVEMIKYFNLMDCSIDNFYYFDNASFPGSFVLASHYYYFNTCGRNNQQNKTFEWYANSLIESLDYIKTPLADKYSLFNNNKDNWMMYINGNNGDVTNIDVIRNIEKYHDHKVNLYTSDLGFDTSDDYGSQELVHIIPHLGQILCGLVSLKKEGNLVCKLYTYFTQFNINLMFLLTFLFDKVYICKPITSRYRNSETYIVCKNFGGNQNNNYKIIVNKLMSIIESKKKIIDINQNLMSKEFVHIINISLKQIFGIAQYNSLKEIIELFNKYKEYVGTINDKDLNNKIKQENDFYNISSQQFDQWINFIGIRRINKRLNIKKD